MGLDEPSLNDKVAPHFDSRSPNRYISGSLLPSRMKSFRHSNQFDPGLRNGFIHPLVHDDLAKSKLRPIQSDLYCALAGMVEFLRRSGIATNEDQLIELMGRLDRNPSYRVMANSEKLCQTTSNESFATLLGSIHHDLLEWEKFNQWCRATPLVHEIAKLDIDVADFNSSFPLGQSIVPTAYPFVDARLPQFRIFESDEDLSVNDVRPGFHFGSAMIRLARHANCWIINREWIALKERKEEQANRGESWSFTVDELKRLCRTVGGMLTGKRYLEARSDEEHRENEEFIGRAPLAAAALTFRDDLVALQAAGGLPLAKVYIAVVLRELAREDFHDATSADSPMEGKSWEMNLLRGQLFVSPYLSEALLNLAQVSDSLKRLTSLTPEQRQSAAAVAALFDKSPHCRGDDWSMIFDALAVVIPTESKKGQLRALLNSVQENDRLRLLELLPDFASALPLSQALKGDENGAVARHVLNDRPLKIPALNETVFDWASRTLQGNASASTRVGVAYLVNEGAHWIPDGEWERVSAIVEGNPNSSAVLMAAKDAADQGSPERARLQLRVGERFSALRSARPSEEFTSVQQAALRYISRMSESAITEYLGETLGDSTFGRLLLDARTPPSSPPAEVRIAAPKRTPFDPYSNLSGSGIQEAIKIDDCRALLSRLNRFARDDQSALPWWKRLLSKCTAVQQTALDAIARNRTCFDLFVAHAQGGSVDRATSILTSVNLALAHKQPIYLTLRKDREADWETEQFADERFLHAPADPTIMRGIQPHSADKIIIVHGQLHDKTRIRELQAIGLPLTVECTQTAKNRFPQPGEYWLLVTAKMAHSVYIPLAWGCRNHNVPRLEMRSAGLNTLKAAIERVKELRRSE